jgi:hypothetical protein
VRPDLRDIVKAHRVREVLSQHRTPERLLLHLPHSAHTSALEPEVEATDTSEQ